MPQSRNESILWIALVASMIFPTGMAALYFLILPSDGEPNSIMQTAYGFGKIVQFAFPILFVRWYRGRWPTLQRPGREGVAFGVGFGLAVVAAMFALYFLVLKGTALFERTPEMIRTKLQQMNVATPWRYLGLAGFVVVLHSLFEEYYWRWFVFGELRERVGFVKALALSSLAFMSHHVIVLYVYFPGWFWVGVVPLSLGIAVGGAVWAWLYERTGSLWAAWISHVLVDAGIFALGWILIR